MVVESVSSYFDVHLVCDRTMDIREFSLETRFASNILLAGSDGRSALFFKCVPVLSYPEIFSDFSSGSRARIQTNKNTC